MQIKVQKVQGVSNFSQLAQLVFEEEKCDLSLLNS